MAELPSTAAPALPPSPPAGSPGEYSQCDRMSEPPSAAIDSHLTDTVIAPAELHTFSGARVNSCASTSKAWKCGLLDRCQLVRIQPGSSNTIVQRMQDILNGGVLSTSWL